MKLPNKSLERKLFNSGYGYVIGVDEVGMGCLAGPVVVCAISIMKDFYKKNHPSLGGLRESKLLSSNQREKFAKELLKGKDLVYALAYSHPKTIDKLNIYKASREAMKRAIKKLTMGTIADSAMVPMVLVDGNKKIPGLKGDQIAIVKGDRKIFAIACASIIAKVFRDKLMEKYSKKYPGYGFEKHKGYGTARHRARLALMGPCEIHRQSFKLK